ncbi:DUF4012 domain-containing protein [Arthrobacter sp. KFRI-F3372]|uniref:DUF4012 domain-containing protein n=1 Tax=Pseudarthrobacter oxydans TaxID=1671 RepID=UPI00279F1E42|nr:DUF4012 domain-containing protein [Arthrobacter sp. KFRI-F3372]
MTISDSPLQKSKDNPYFGKRKRTFRGTSQRTALLLAGVAIVTLLVVSCVWVAVKANSIKTELQAAADLIPQLKQEIAAGDARAATTSVKELNNHTSNARQTAGDPIWTLASGLPWVGPNVSALSEVARSADDVAALGAAPLVEVYGSLDWSKLLPSSVGSDLGAVKAAAPDVANAAHAVRASAERLQELDKRSLLPQIAEPLEQAGDQLAEVTGALDSAADAARVAPALLGADGARNYLLMVQNNAEVRASGGIPGALAVLTLDGGKMSLGAQGSAGTIGVVSPPLALDQEQRQIYSSRLGKYMQDVNLTPDFPTAAANAREMWQRTTGQGLDGVISIDPVVLSYVLESTGPVQIDTSAQGVPGVAGLPRELNGHNVVSTLLSDVYAKIEQPTLQDAYFAVAAREIFSNLSAQRNQGQSLISALTKGVDEGRVLLWSAQADEQSVIAKYSLSGSVTGPSVSPAQFGVYFNDGTGAKMDYYVKRTVQLIKECPKDGYEETTIRITSTNTAPADAATSLPAYVTGNGVFGVPPGSVQTNIVAYGPVQAQVETAKMDGQKTEFAPYFHDTRPVGVLAIRLAPGESKTVDFTFGKIVQHTEPNVVVTPTVQDVKDVTLPTETVACG